MPFRDWKGSRAALEGAMSEHGGARGSTKGALREQRGSREGAEREH